jgi:hypothetical protein
MTCETYCSHGGVCGREAGHEGQHDTGYCKFGDAEAVSRSEANAAVESALRGLAGLDD